MQMGDRMGDDLLITIIEDQDASLGCEEDTNRKHSTFIRCKSLEKILR